MTKKRFITLKKKFLTLISPPDYPFFPSSSYFYTLLNGTGARVNTKDSRWLTPLHRAVASKSLVSHLSTLLCTVNLGDFGQIVTIFINIFMMIN